MSAGFATERLQAEPLDRSHEAELAALHADERVMATLGGETANAEENRGWLETNLRHWEENGFGIFVFRERASGDFVGRAGIRRLEIESKGEVELTYALAAEQWGRGFATEIATGLVTFASERGLTDLVAYTEPTNLASRRVMEKTGFVYEREIELRGRGQVLYRRVERDL